MKRLDSTPDPDGHEPTGHALRHLLLTLFGLLALVGGLATVIGLLLRNH